MDVPCAWRDQRSASCWAIRSGAPVWMVDTRAVNPNSITMGRAFIRHHISDVWGD
jgi:hypothetical protein